MTKIPEDTAWLPYVAPMAAFLLLTQAEGWLPGAGGESISPWYPSFYAAKIAVVVGLLVFFRSTWRDLRPFPGLVGTAASIGLGLLVALAWVGLDGRYPTFGALGTRTGFDPMGLDEPWPWIFLAVRFFGLVGVVPLMEELFWRSFLMRWLIDPDFQRVPIGKVTPLAVCITSAAFAAAHPEWLPALLTGLAWAGLLSWTRSLSACVISHAVANLALGAYVVTTGDWKFL
jgi:CAAX prenyl protease-like protein